MRCLLYFSSLPCRCPIVHAVSNGCPPGCAGLPQGRERRAKIAEACKMPWRRRRGFHPHMLRDIDMRRPSFLQVPPNQRRHCTSEDPVSNCNEHALAAEILWSRIVDATRMDGVDCTHKWRQRARPCGDAHYSDGRAFQVPSGPELPHSGEALGCRFIRSPCGPKHSDVAPERYLGAIARCAIFELIDPILHRGVDVPRPAHA